MSRELTRRRAGQGRPTQGRVLLSDLGRLPLEAAIDMACAELEAHPARTAAMLDELAARLAPEGERGAVGAGRLLGALARREVAAIGEAALPGVASLAAIALGAPHGAGLVTAALLASPEQLGAALLEPLTQATRRDAAARDEVIEAIALWRGSSDARWREHQHADARDGLTSALVEQLVAVAELDAACRVAGLWPPMRTALTRLGAALAGVGRVDALRRLVAPYDTRSPLRAALLTTCATVAASHGHGGEAVAAWVFLSEPDSESFALVRSCTAPALWAARRDALVGTLLDRGEAPWLVTLLAAQPDAAEALGTLVQRHARRGRTVEAALDALAELDPPRATRAAARRLLTVVQDQGATPQAVRRARRCLERAATSEPGLAEAYVGLLRRELGEATPRLRALRG